MRLTNWKRTTKFTPLEINRLKKKEERKISLSGINLSFPNPKYILVFLVFIFIIFGSIRFIRIVNEYVYWRETRDLYTAALFNIPVDYSHLKPFRNWAVSDLENIRARAAIVLVTETEKAGSRVIFKKNASKILPIASLTKMLTAYIALKNYELRETVVITKEVIRTDQDISGLDPGEKITVEKLLYSMLIESSNDAAYALAGIMGERNFLDLMNLQVKEMKLNNTRFVSPSGIDPEFLHQGYDRSSVYDLAMMIKYMLEQAEEDVRINKIFEITRTAEQKIFLADGSFHHRALNTNKLLDEFPGIIGAKTGETFLAGECLLMIIPRPRGEGYVIAVILGSDDRFQEMEKLINWLHKAYRW